MASLISRLLSLMGKKRHISYEEAEKMARHPDPGVRKTIAANTAPLGQIDLLLARDSDLDVRAALAKKIAKLAPGLSSHEQDKIRQLTYETLNLLVRDQAVRVRRILSETLKDVANASPEVINRLARDAEYVVAAPVLEFSPVLTDRDLLDIISGGLAEGGLAVISRRSHVPESVSDAIVNKNDDTAVTYLLRNPSAQIREETLDRIVNKALHKEIWHEPLVKRQELSSNMAERLAQFVAYNLLEVLLDRRDLDLETAEEVRKEFNRRLEDDSKPEIVRKKETGSSKKAAWNAKEESPKERAGRLKLSGELDEATIMEALRVGDRDFVMACLSEISGIPWDVIKKISSTASAKGIISVAWKSGLSMSEAVKLQRNLIRLQPRDIIHAAPGGGFPLSEEEMAWQLDFFKDLSG